jgi:endonuclease YncB( thermonuclease family)
MKKYGIYLIGLSLLLATLGWAAESSPDANLVLGVFTVNHVVDGDTLGVDGLPKTIRFLNIDTEESEKGQGAEERTAAIAKNFQSYIQEQTRNNPYPKANTPLGWDGTLFARQCFPSGSLVKIEFDDPGRQWDFYHRVLGYVFYQKDGKWLNYNVECVRAGLSPYSDKYGPSKRFEREFLQAEREARINKRGIWAPGAMCYPDYDGRLKWWYVRGETIRNFETRYSGNPLAIDILNDIDWQRMESLIGKEVTVFGSFHYDRLEGEKGSIPAILIDHNDGSPVAFLFSDEKLLSEFKKQAEPFYGELVYFTGTLDKGTTFGSQKVFYTFSFKSSQQFGYDTEIVHRLGYGREGRSEAPVAAMPVKVKKLALPLKDTVSWEDASKYMGKEITLSGEIIQAKDIGNLTFLNFSKDFNASITLVIFKDNYGKFPEAPDKFFQGHTIKAKGTISEYKGKTQMVIETPEQIQIVD